MNLFHKIIVEQEEILKRKGFTEEQLQNPAKSGTLINSIETGFVNSLNLSIKTNEPESFFAETKGYFSGSRDLVFFRFHFQADAAKMTLDAKAMFTKMDDVEKIFVMTKTDQVPSAKQVHRTLKYSRALKKIARLLDGPGKKINKGKRI